MCVCVCFPLALGEASKQPQSLFAECSRVQRKKKRQTDVHIYGHARKTRIEQNRTQCTTHCCLCSTFTDSEEEEEATEMPKILQTHTHCLLEQMLYCHRFDT